jgi:two-component system sensor histidine kinase KdpD
VISETAWGRASIITAGTTVLNSKDQLSASELDVLLRAIVGESERLARIVQNLLSITRLESPTVVLNSRSESIDEVLGAALDRMGSRLASERVTLDLEKDLPLLEMEPALIEQVFVNLLENSARYSPAESPVELQARAVGSEVLIRVADRGPGIPEDQRERVFEKFHRAGPARTDDGGMGLGLTICRAIVQAHGGTIHIASNPGGGAVLEVRLPVSSGSAGAHFQSRLAS